MSNLEKGLYATHELDAASWVCSLVKDKNMLYYGLWDGTIKIFDLTTKKCIAILQEHVSRVHCLTINRNRLYSGSNDATIKIWDLATNKCIDTLQGHKGWVECLFIDGNHLYSGSNDATIKIWDLATNKCIDTLQGHEAGVECLFIDGNHLYSGSADRTIKIWDLSTNKCIASLQGDEGIVTHYGNHAGVTSLIKDGNQLYSGSDNGIIKIWDLTTNKCIATLQANGNKISSLIKDGNLLYSSSDGPTIKIQNLNASYLTLLRAATLRDFILFNSFGDACKNAVYRELDAIEDFSNDDSGCAKDAFLNQNGKTTTDEKRAQAIYRFVLKEVVSLLELGSRRKALDLFKRLPDRIKNAIFGEHAHNHQIFDDKRKEAIQNYLTSTAKKT